MRCLCRSLTPFAITFSLIAATAPAQTAAPSRSPTTAAAPRVTTPKQFFGHEIGADYVLPNYTKFRIPNTYIAELNWFVKGGYSIPEALKAATITSAKLLDMEDKLGSLAPGKLADVIVVDGKPDENLDDLRKIDTVIKDGQVAVRSGQVVIPRHVPAPLAKPAPRTDIR